MIVVYEAPSCSDTAALERLLISKYTERFAIGTTTFGSTRCLNVGSGGERASGSPHYCYIAFRQDDLLRRG